MKKILAGVFAVVVMAFAVNAIAASPTLTLTKTSFSKGESITVKFIAPKYVGTAWVGIIPSSIAHGDEATNDAHDITYQYLNGKTKGTLTFSAPNQPGQWDFRMNNSDSNGAEVASVTFTVK